MTEEDLMEPTPENSGTEHVPEDACSMESLRRENEALRQQAAEAEAWRQRLQQQAVESAVLQALIRHGAHPDAAKLLIHECGEAHLDEHGTLMDEEVLIRPVMQAWGSLFTTGTPQGTPPIQPPLRHEGRMDLNSLRSLSTEEINRSWPLIRETLHRKN